MSKRSDVTTQMLLDAYAEHGVVDAFDALVDQGIPIKILIAAIERDCTKEILTYGVSPRGYFPAT